MKKILHVLASSAFSGAESVAITIITNMNEEYEMAYSSPRGKIEKKLKKKKITYYGMNKLNINELRKIIKEYHPNIIHAHDYRASFLCTLLKGKAKLILHIHNNAPWIKKFCLRSMTFLIASKKADKILIVSNSIQNEYIFSKIIKNKFICIDNPVSSKNILSQVKNYQANKKYDICCTARISRVKDPITFLNIVYELKKKMPTIIAIWIGGSDDLVYVNSILNEVRKLELEKNIKFLGWKENPYTYMAESKIFLLTSEYEGYGLAAFEALSLGLPCVVSNVGGLSSVVDDSCGKLCEKGNIMEYCNEITNLLTNEDYYINKSKKAIIKSKKLDNLEEYCTKLDKIYKGVYND